MPRTLFFAVLVQSFLPVALPAIAQTNRQNTEQDSSSSSDDLADVLDDENAIIEDDKSNDATGNPPAADVDEGTNADDQKKSTRVALSINPTGITRNVPGRWSTLTVNGSNPTANDSEELGVVTVDKNANMQFARRLWIPANARRQAWLPFKIPDDVGTNRMQIPLKYMHVNETDVGEKFQNNVVGMPTSERSLLMSWEPLRTGILLWQRNPDMKSDEKTNILSKVIYAAKDSSVGDRDDLGLINMSGGFLPPTLKPFDSMDQVVVADDSILDDTVAVQRLRAWLHSGGRLWIMVDQLPEKSVRALIGDACCYSIVDRVELNDYAISVLAQTAFTKDASFEWSLDQPETFVRVLVDTDDIHSEIDGWPAAFWKQVGHGEVLFTTLGAQGWLNDQRASEPLRSLSSRLFIPKIEPTGHVKEISDFLDKDIGYSIPTRAVVGSVLVCHMLIVLAVGIWLARRRSLQHLAVLIPVAALLAAGTLVIIGWRNTSQVPSTIATGQIAHALPDSANVRIESVAAIYSQKRRALPIHTSADTTTQLVGNDRENELTRVVWEDSGDSNWEFVEQPPGVVRHIESDSLVTLNQPWSFLGRFTENGFEGKLRGIPSSDVQDPVVASIASASLSVQPVLGEEGKFVEKSTLLPDQYIEATLMSDTQQERQTFIRKLATQDGNFLSKEPSLILWTKPIPSGAEFGDGFERPGWALSTVPIRLERASVGDRFKIPASFVSIRSGSSGPSMFFNAETGQWLDGMNKPGEAEVRCVVPAAVMPCQLTKANIVLRINAPGRRLELKGFVDGAYVTIFEKESPSGLLEYDLEDTSALDLDSEGCLRLLLSISPTQEEIAAKPETSDPMDLASPSRNKWGIDYLHVSLEGTAK